MKKMNKKGFTLIEMLVVIAIIAVLVAIIIPTVTSATDKAAAATNAANLRSVKAEITTALLSNDAAKYKITPPASTGSPYTVELQTDVSLPTAKKCGVVADGAKIGAYITEDKVVTVFFVQSEKAYTIDSFVKVAEGTGALAEVTIATGYTPVVLENVTVTP